MPQIVVYRVSRQPVADDELATQMRMALADISHNMHEPDLRPYISL